LQWHIGGGAGGIQHFMAHLMDPMAAMFKVLGNPEITPRLKRKIAEGVLEEAANHSAEQLAMAEDEMLLALLRLRARHEDQASRKGRERVAPELPSLRASSR
jgi:carnitine 3-dehydrogenase